MLLYRLLASFMAVGIGAFGGGNAAIPLIRHEVVTRYEWLSDAELAEVITLAQMTPGPLAINSATYTGFHVAGLTGATVATLGVILPSITIVSGFIAIGNLLGNHRYLGRLRQGARPGVLVMLALAVWSIGETSIADGRALPLAGLALGLLLLAKGRLHPVALIVASGLLGVFALRV